MGTRGVQHYLRAPVVGGRVPSQPDTSLSTMSFTTNCLLFTLLHYHCELELPIWVCRGPKLWHGAPSGRGGLRIRSFSWKDRNVVLWCREGAGFHR